MGRFPRRSARSTRTVANLPVTFLRLAPAMGGRGPGRQDAGSARFRNEEGAAVARLGAAVVGLGLAALVVAYLFFGWPVLLVGVPALVGVALVVAAVVVSETPRRKLEEHRATRFIRRAATGRFDERLLRDAQATPDGASGPHRLTGAGDRRSLERRAITLQLNTTEAAIGPGRRSQRRHAALNARLWPWTVSSSLTSCVPGGRRSSRRTSACRGGLAVGQVVSGVRRSPRCAACPPTTTDASSSSAGRSRRRRCSGDGPRAAPDPGRARPPLPPRRARRPGPRGSARPRQPRPHESARPPRGYACPGRERDRRDAGETPPAVALFGDETLRTGLSRAVVYRWFTDPESRRAYPEEDHPLHARPFVADLRAASARPHTRTRAEVVSRRSLERSPEFAAIWDGHEVGIPHGPEKRLWHPEVGLMTLQCQLLHDLEQAQALLVLTATPGSESYERLVLLAVLGRQRCRADGRRPAPGACRARQRRSVPRETWWFGCAAVRR